MKKIGSEAKPQRGNFLMQKKNFLYKNNILHKNNILYKKYLFIYL